MKTIQLILILFFTSTLFAQLKQEPEKRFKCFTKAEMKKFNAEIIADRQNYYARKGISEANLRKAANHHVLFRWPMQSSADYDFNYNNSVITNFVDQDQDDNPTEVDVLNTLFIEDWLCGKRTYDGHRGEDIALFPFSWYMMDKEAVMAVAAAPGVITTRRDGNFDRNCEWEGAGPSNVIVITHADGTMTSYNHLKNNSLTSKQENDSVEEGEFLGFVASSGRSTGPHLHFEITDVNGMNIDPFTGACNLLNNDTWWKSQRNYWQPQVNRIMTHNTLPVDGKCSDNVYGDNHFGSGAMMWTSIAFQDAQEGETADCYLIQPNGQTYSTWEHSFSSSRSSSLKILFHQLPNGNNGNWTVKVVYRGNNYYHFFSVNCASTNTALGVATGSQGYITSNTINSSVAHLNLTDTKVLYQAATEITFSPGFEIKAGAHLKARIKGCDFVE